MKYFIYLLLIISLAACTESETDKTKSTIKEYNEKLLILRKKLSVMADSAGNDISDRFKSRMDQLSDSIKNLDTRIEELKNRVKD
jgi:hypothetical protein